MSSSNREISAKGIILRKTKYSDTSLILDVFTLEFGHITLMAKGVRKQKSKAIGLLEILNEVDFTLYKNPSSEWHIFKDGELIKAHLRETKFENGILMQAAAEIYRQLILEMSDYHKLYELIVSYLDYIRAIPKNGIAIFWRFLLRMFVIIGIEIDVEKCLECNKNKSFFAYYPQKHGFICSACYRPVQSDQLIKLSKQQAFILNNLRQIGNMLNDFKLDKTMMQKLNRIFLLHLSEHFHKKFYLKSLELLV
ncbi:MAG: DNA repair protein RecO [Candidatus Cloacimonetes bacterium]|nr:DNA repair protein RecO [Candidatus Cloacimonadota bacterium]MCF7813285.1 DNA repair protein RecO [Candidatus Cloacimonadota bacterium]MCF7867360.1 DNA repair protein RecO [Candidatus Cloacimonadota bacterium]MCF7882794.1 DNA repair protein RecO [Candidatus Cloacimonadota bacterium]